MKPRHAFALLLLPVVFGVVGCSGSSSLGEGATFDDVRRRVEARNAQVRALTGDGRISIDTPEIGNSGSVGVRLSKPDSLLIDITGPFGVGLAKGLVTSRAFTFYNQWDNMVFEGETTLENMRRVLRFPIEFADVLDVLSGTVGFRAAPAVTPVVTVDGGTWTAVYSASSESIEYVVETGYEAVTRVTRRNAQGEMLEQIQFKDFRRRSGMYLPSVVSIVRPLSEESLTLVYERTTLNNLPVDFTFKVPRSATRVSL